MSLAKIILRAKCIDLKCSSLSTKTLFNLNYQKIPFFYQTGTLRYLLPVALEEDDIGESPAPANDGHILEHLLHVDPTVAQQLAPVTHHPPVQPVLAHTTFDK